MFSMIASTSAAGTMHPKALIKSSLKINMDQSKLDSGLFQKKYHPFLKRDGILLSDDSNRFIADGPCGLILTGLTTALSGIDEALSANVIFGACLTFEGADKILCNDLINLSTSESKRV